MINLEKIWKQLADLRSGRRHRKVEKHKRKISERFVIVGERMQMQKQPNYVIGCFNK